MVRDVYDSEKGDCEFFGRITVYIEGGTELEKMMNSVTTGRGKVQMDHRKI